MFPKQDDERMNRLLKTVELIVTDGDGDVMPTVVFFPPNILNDLYGEEETDIHPPDSEPIDDE